MNNDNIIGFMAGLLVSVFIILIFSKLNEYHPNIEYDKKQCNQYQNKDM